MIAAASLTTDSLPFNWFDGALLIILGFGIFRGRKNGMTKEVVPLFEWIILVAAAGLGYPFLAQIYHDNCGLSKLLSGLLGYLSIALVGFLIFTAIKKVLNPRLTGSNVFGSAEYYLGMFSGMIRYACMIIFALALINAKHYTSAEIAATKAYNEKWYGGGIYSGDYVPDLHTVQDSIFKASFTGPYIKDYLAIMLIQTGPDDGSGGGSHGPPKPAPVVHIGS
jgi:uncharacterized membrane protein required for colicin V production